MRKCVMPAGALLLIAGIVWLARCSADKSGPLVTDSQPVTLSVQIRSVEVRRTGDHAQVIVTALFDQSGQTPIRMNPPLVSLLTANQTAAQRFIGAMLPEQVLTGGDPAEVALHFWLPAADLNAPLTLAASGRQYPVILAK